MGMLYRTNCCNVYHHRKWLVASDSWHRVDYCIVETIKSSHISGLGIVSLNFKDFFAFTSDTRNANKRIKE